MAPINSSGSPVFATYSQRSVCASTVLEVALVVTAVDHDGHGRVGLSQLHQGGHAGFATQIEVEHQHVRSVLRGRIEQVAGATHGAVDLHVGLGRDQCADSCGQIAVVFGHEHANAVIAGFHAVILALRAEVGLLHEVPASRL